MSQISLKFEFASGILYRYDNFISIFFSAVDRDHSVLYEYELFSCIVDLSFRAV